MELTCTGSEPKCLVIMTVVSLCSDCKALKFLKNLHGNNEQECLCFIQLKQELQKLPIKLKTAIKINDILKYETKCGVNLVIEYAKCNSLSFQLQEGKQLSLSSRYSRMK